MKAWQISEFGSPDVLQRVEIPDPQPRDGWISINIRAFGINRSELYTRQGHSGDAATIPRVLGIECVGVVTDGGGTDLQPGQTVAAAMGGMGRTHDGGYAEKTILPRSNVFPLTTRLDWPTLGALPETYLTAWGAIHEAIALQPGGSLLIRGGTSAAGLACVSIAKEMGCTVLATTRTTVKAPVLTASGVDHVLVDDGSVSSRVREIFPDGVNGVVEFVGMEHTILDCLQCTAPRGTVAMVGFLGNRWDYRFFPWMPSTVRLTRYASETIHADHSTPALQTIVENVAKGA
ncbi:MAG: zinc-binding dehydrogenase, partial [Verrucomicrobiae bacterium]|nr:zinc-binding dehydrogenase [Verrucomicrobiae bacterium]